MGSLRTRPKAILVCLLATLSYLVARLGGTLIVHPQTAWPLWRDCSLLLAVLLLVPRGIWPILIPGAFAGFILYDLQAGVPIGSIVWLILADTVEVLIAALCLNYFFDGVPRLNSVKALAKYSFFAVILAPFAGAFVGALGIRGDYWISWRICFLSEALAFLILMPAILSWVSEKPAWVRKSSVYYLEFAALISALVFLGYITFVASGRSNLPALLYSLVPFLLWSALRFGSMGASSSVIVVACLSMWGAVHGRGPFTPELAALYYVVPLQLFLFVSATPFMVLASLVEEHKQAEETLRDSEARARAKANELETVLDAVPVAMFIAHDPGCRRMTGNRSTYELLRLQVGANISKSAPVEERPTYRIMQEGLEIPPEELPMQRAAATGTAVVSTALSLVFEDATEKQIIGNATPLFGLDSKPCGAVGAYMDITERKRSEEALRESEDKLRLLLDSTAEAIYGIDLEGRCTFCNPACLRALGYERVDELLGKNMHDLIHHTREDGTLFPVEECRVFRAFQSGEGAHVDDEVLWRANGTSFPAEYWSYPQRRGQEVVGAVVAFIDITQRKLAEAALADVSRRLIDAQEQERTRIARELHDDIGQRLALLTIELERLQENSPDLPAEVRNSMGDLQKQTTEIATDIQTLSHELHSAKLEYLGIAAAMTGFCKEFGKQTKVQVDFKSHDLPSPLSPDISLCLLRVLQEALHNSAKHSGVRHFEVRLWGTSHEIHLTVGDFGAGFDSEAARESRGLGLISMEERLKLLNGTFSIESQPKRGTTIHARVPIRSKSDSLRAAG